MILTHNGADGPQAHDPSPQPPDPLTLRDRLLAATYRCVERFGLGKTTIDDIVKESGLSRATIYRQFPGGRDELLLETVGWELANYFNALADHVRDAPDLAQLLEQGLAFAHRSVAEHVGAAQDPRHRARAAAAAAHGRVGQDAAVHRRLPAPVPARGRPRPAGCGPASTSTGRPSTSPGCILSLINAPGRWDLDDPAQVRTSSTTSSSAASSRDAPNGPGEERDGDPPGDTDSQEPLLWRVVRSAIAPPVLEDGGHDAPLSPRGRILFWGTVSVLVVAIAVLFVVTLAR